MINSSFIIIWLFKIVYSMVLMALLNSESYITTVKNRIWLCVAEEIRDVLCVSEREGGRDKIDDQQ